MTQVFPPNVSGYCEGCGTVAAAAPTPEATMFQLADLIKPHAIRAAAILGIADHLAEGPRHIADLAAACGVLPSPLARLLLFLAQHGIFAEVNPEYFGLTPLALFLRTGNSLHREITSLHGQRVAAAAADILYTLRTGRPAYEHLFGESLFEACARDHDVSASFEGAMAANARRTLDAVIAAYDWREASSYVDVGGHRGLLLAAVLLANPDARGILFDQDQVLREGNCLREAGVDDRGSVATGDFFASVPSGRDCYLLSNVLHNWDDEAATRILHTCRTAMPSEARLLVIERVLPATKQAHHAKYLDMRMMLVFGGRERTQAEYVTLLEAAAFTVRRVVPTTSQPTIIEAVPA